MYYLETGYRKHDRLRNALLAALALHAVLILGLSFEAGKADYRAPQIEVTLATRSSDRAPDDATMMAQSNQVGSGDPAERQAVTSRDRPLPIDAAGQQQPPPAGDQSPASQRLLATRTQRERGVSARAPEHSEQAAQLKGISPEADRISQQLASLEAELDRQTQTYADRPRVRRLTAASAKQAVDAAYLLDWRRRPIVPPPRRAKNILLFQYSLT